MSFPNFKNKHGSEALFSPKDFLRYQKEKEKYDKFDPPTGVIFCYSRRLLEYVIENHKVRRVRRFLGDMYLLGETKNKIALVGNFGIGAPAVTTLLEELVAFGVKRFISIGTAGALQTNLRVGNLVVCEKAIRDEGTSHHYLKPSKYAYASKAMTRRIKNALDALGQKYVVGSSWTIDAIYRETVAEAKKYQKEGVSTVEMEASALFAVAKFKGVEMGAIFTISDSLAGIKWSPQFQSRRTKSGLETLYRTAITALTEKS